MTVFAIVFFVICAVSSHAQVPQEAGAPASDVSNIPKPVISTVDSVNMRNGPNDARTPKKTSVQNDTCLLPPLTLIRSATVEADQLQVGAKAMDEYQQACLALRSHKLADAEKHLRKAVREYPKYSAAWVTLGQMLAADKRADEGQSACLQASIVAPKYLAAYLCLADIATRTHAWNAVLQLSERALEVDPTQAVLAYEYNAAANLNLHHLAEAEKSGLRAVDIDKDNHEPRAHFVLAQIYEAKGDKENEIKQLREYVKHADNPEDVAAVNEFLLQLENRKAQTATDHANTEASSQEDKPGDVAIARRSWAPADIDEVVPPEQSERSCPLSQILKDTSRRTQDLIQSLQRFSADERIEQIEFDKKGKSRNAAIQGNYVVQIEENSSRFPAIKEYRAGAVSNSRASVVDTGSAVFALIFHPSHIANFDFRCEGLTLLNGSPSWQLRFEEAPDPNVSFQAIRVGGSVYLPRLKGRAWIATNTYEVLQIETDLVSPIREINFELEHLIIRYAPVQFKNRAVRLWLPESTHLYLAYRGHRYERVHTFSHFQLFSVESDQAVREATLPAKADPAHLLATESRLLEPQTGSH
jgi:tetratricopeptide (TPR) repeat protein